MIPGIETLLPKKLVGKRVRMSFANDRTVELWRSFMPRRKEIVDRLATHLFSVQIYGNNFDVRNLDPRAEFEKWAAVEIADLDAVPDGMETLRLDGGLYAVFDHRGGPDAAEGTFRYIFDVWLPASGYSVNRKPHFEILGEKYGDGGPDSEEEIWIPIRPNE
jgi:AraC family transcriptional regulator